MAGIKVTNLTKAYGDHIVVRGISFAVEPGEFVAVLGPSGCGKSTTLRLVAGLERPDGGTIEIGGVDVTNQPAHRRAIAMVFQSYALFPHLTVAENIVFGLQVRGTAKPEREARLAKVAALVGLERYLKHKPSQLSGGQRQRVALARAIVSERPVCLMDEPLSNLDAQLRHDMRLELRSLQKQLGMTVLYVTHDQIEAMTMADRVVLMQGGGIEQAGSPAEMYERPATAFAARFIGQPAMNLIAAAGSPTLGVRPEHVVLHEPGEGRAGMIESVEYLGAETVLTVRAGNDAIVARVAGRCARAPGDLVGLSWHADHSHYFDPERGGRIDPASR